jgi:hypothetical protein
MLTQDAAGVGVDVGVGVRVGMGDPAMRFTDIEEPSREPPFVVHESTETA